MRDLFQRLDNLSQPKLTSEQWQSLKPGVKVLDPDGWDRKNFQWSWHKEEITEAEYQKRLAQSTVEMRPHGN